MAPKTEETILIIDDEPTIRDLLSMILSEEGFNISVLGEFRGMEAIIETKPSLIIMDLRMPKIGGTKLSRMLKSQPQTAQVPILALSAASQDEVADMCFDAFLPKPFDLDKLLEQVYILLEQKKLREEPLSTKAVL